MGVKTRLRNNVMILGRGTKNPHQSTMAGTASGECLSVCNKKKLRPVYTEAVPCGTVPELYG